jgi:transcriptional regulator with XRE-family HTH domain
MNIQRNVVTTLKMIQAQNKLSLEEFAKSMGVGRSSLQEYMAEKRSPRLDTLELMANKLKVPILSFVSGKLSLDIWSDTCKTLHPLLQPLAAAQLHALVYISDKIYAMEQRLAEKAHENGSYQYTIINAKNPSGSRASYGLLVQTWYGNSWHAVMAIAPFSEDRAAVFSLTQFCAKLQIPPDRMMEVVEDFLAGRIRYL